MLYVSSTDFQFSNTQTLKISSSFICEIVYLSPFESIILTVILSGDSQLIIVWLKISKISYNREW